MFIRTIKGKTKTYLAIVEGAREGKKVKQKMLLNLGDVESLDSDKMRLMGSKIIELFGGAAIKEASDISEAFRSNWGAMEVVDRLIAEFGIDKLFADLYKDRKVQHDVLATVKLMLASRLCKPCSKLETFTNKNFYAPNLETNLQNLYRSLDELCTYEDKLKLHIFNKQKEFNGGKVEVVFFDVTTLYFESKNSDNLRDFGYSKDCKFNEVQVVLSLIINDKGMPLSYGLFKGNTFEGKSLVPFLQDLRNKYDIKNVTIVADRGMCSFGNLKEISNAGFNYIVGAKLRASSNGIKAEALDDKGYKTLVETEDGRVIYKLLDHNKKKGEDELKEQLICLWSSKREKKDKKDRERLIGKAQSLLETGSLHDKRGAKKYIKADKKQELTIDQNKICEDSKWDGYYAISSNTKLNPAQIVEAYHGLWQVEESFRNFKNHLEARPMYHWTPKRITGHIMLNFIALVLQKHLTLKLGTISNGDIRDALNDMQKSDLIAGGKKVTCYSNLSENSKTILKALNIPIPKNALKND